MGDILKIRAHDVGLGDMQPGWTDAVRDLSQLLHQGESIYQMMQVTGEEGITLADYVTYQKSLFLDMVYLQQDAYGRLH